MAANFSLQQKGKAIPSNRESKARVER